MPRLRHDMEQRSQRRSTAVIKTRASGHADYVRGVHDRASGITSADPV